MNLMITTFGDTIEDPTIIEMYGIQDDDVTIEVGDAGVSVKGAEKMKLSDVPLDPQNILGVSAVLWKDAVTLYPEIEGVE